MGGKEIYEWLRERRVARRERDERQRGRWMTKRYMNG
jgi:hypothetical protein